MCRTHRIVAADLRGYGATEAPAGGPHGEGYALTEREREILRLVAAGLSNAEIAARLVISPLTAKTHVARVLAKLGCHDRAQLVTLSYETGFVRPGDPQASPAETAAY